MNRAPGPLKLGAREFPPAQRLVMAIVNRTPDSFFRPGLTWDEAAALERVFPGPIARNPQLTAPNP